MRLGTSIREKCIPFKDEMDFVIKNNYNIVQLWYQKGVINTLYENDSINAIKFSKIPIILHAAFDINDFENYSNDLIQTLLKLEHKEVILHPMIKTEIINECTNSILVEKVIILCNKLKEKNIKVYVENNHAKMKTFYTIKQWKNFFELAPSNVELLIDVVHVLFEDDYDYLKQLINIKYPGALHIADTKKGVVGKKHLHLPIGAGIIDFNYIFKELLKGFDGLVILEINNTDYNMINSKNKIREIIDDN